MTGALRAKVEVLDGFWIGGKHAAVPGMTVELDIAGDMDVVASGRARPADPQAYAAAIAEHTPGVIATFAATRCRGRGGAAGVS